MHKLISGLPKSASVFLVEPRDRQELIIARSTDLSELAAGLSGESQTLTFRQLLAVTRKLLTDGLKFKSWKIFYTSGNSFYFYLLPLILLGRFVGKKINLAYYNYTDLDRLESPDFLTRWLFRQLSHILVLTEFQQQRLRKQKYPARVEPVTPLVNAPTATRSVRLQPHLLSILPAEPTTNISTLLQAFTMVKEKYPRTELTLLTRGSLYTRWETYFTKHDFPGVHISTYTPQTVATALSETDLFVQCSHLRNLSPGLVTALLSGMPVITTPPGYDAAINNMSNLITTDANSAGEMANMIIRLVEDEELVATLHTNGARLGRILQRRSEQYHSGA